MRIVDNPRTPPPSRESIFLNAGFPGFSLRKSLWTEETDSGDKLGAPLNAEELTDGRREVIGLAD
jgi:hypothetical protein